MSERVYIGFSTHKGFNLTSSLIRWFLKTPYSHVYVRIFSDSLGRDLIYEASGLKVHFVGKQKFLEKSKVVKEYQIETSAEIKVKMLQFAIDNLEKPYGIKQLVGMVWVLLGRKLDKRWRNPFPNGEMDFICSELAWDVLEDLGFEQVSQEDADSISPLDVDQFLMNSRLSLSSWPS